MNKLMQAFMLFSCLSLAACSTSVKGPVSGKKYEVNIGCTDDMKRYEQEREEVMDGKQVEETSPLPGECAPVDEPRDLN